MKFFSLQNRQGIAFVTLNRPPANALATEVLKEIGAMLDGIEADDDIRVIVLKGEGRFFSAGADIKEFTEVDSEQGFKEIAQLGQRTFDQIENFSKPVMAVIHGAALGGGLELAMACHIRIAADNAKLGLPELQLGIIPGFAGTQRLPRLVGIPKAAEMMLTAEPISGKEAESLGLVNHAYPEEILFEKANEMAEKIAKKGPISIQSVLQLLQFTKVSTFEIGVQREADFFGHVFVTEDAKEGISAFLEKRQPSFKGN